MTYQCTEEKFLKDISAHEMIVIRDDGINRHIRFKKPGTGCMHFDLITWPGYLCYTGDMGTYVFQRLEDMFEFFRTDRKYSLRDGATLSINPSYWGEKLQSVDRHGGYEEFDKDKFTAVINSYRVNWMREYRHILDKDERRELWEAVEQDVLWSLDDHEQSAFIAANSFSHRVNGKNFAFDDLWEHRLNSYTYRFIWCCYALAWGIEQYDNELSIEKSLIETT
jgi:hypothetical protein